MSPIQIVTNKWAQLLVIVGIIAVAGGAGWIAVGSALGATPMAPLLLLVLGMMPFLIGLEELANRRKNQRQAFHQR